MPYSTCISRCCVVDQSTGVVRYSRRPKEGTVGQLISEVPLSLEAPSFSFLINSPSSECGIGVCPNTYPANEMPGWNRGSVGYHADTGGIYLGNGKSSYKKYTCVMGDIMKCEVNFQKESVKFYKNGDFVCEEELHLDFSNLHAAIGLGSEKDSIRLLEKWPWRRRGERPSLSSRPRYFSAICRECQVHQDAGVVRNSSSSTAVGQFIGACPLTAECPSFSVKIVNPGKRREIGIGVCPSDYQPNQMPGWLEGSVGYHADNGGIYDSDGSACKKAESCDHGDVMKCELNFSQNSVRFYKNLKLVSEVKVSGSLQNLHPAIGFNSPMEAVRLLEKQPWRSAKETVLVAPVIGESGETIFPFYWRNNATMKRDEINFVEAGRATKDAIIKVMQATWESQNVGLGRDAKNLQHQTFRVTSVRRVENRDLFEHYNFERKSLQKRLASNGGQACKKVEDIKDSKSGVVTTSQLIDFMKKTLHQEINEHYLFHGCSAESADVVAKKGFDVRLAADGLLGRGVYFAEKFTKSDQYAVIGNKGELTLILARVLLGNVYLCNDHSGARLCRPPCTVCFKDKCLCPNQVLFDSVLYDGSRLFREFVVYDKAHCYPEYIIKYQRV